MVAIEMKSRLNRRQVVSGAIAGVLGSQVVGRGATGFGFDAEARRAETVINVFDVGAAGDGRVDDRAAIQRAINALAAIGGVVWLPAGQFRIGAPGLIMPSNAQRPITLRGDGAGGTGTYGTTLLRSGASPALTAAGTGATNDTMNHGLTVKDLTIHGGGIASTLVRLDRCAAVQFERVRLAYSGGHALHATQLLNSRFTSCLFEVSGSDESTPSVLFDSSNDLETNTVQMMGCHWEENRFTDLQLDGTPERPSVGVIVTNGKFERSNGYAVHFRHARNCVMDGAYFYTNTTFPCVYVESENQNIVSACHLTGTGQPANAYLLQLAQGGYTTIIGNTFIAAATAHIGIDSAYGTPTIVGNVHRSVAGELPVSDLRSNRSGLIHTPASMGFGDGASHVEFRINGASGGQKQLKFESSGIERWYVRANADSESGANSGSNFEIGAADDQGGDLGVAIGINRADGAVRIMNALQHEGSTLGFFGAPPQGVTAPYSALNAADRRSFDTTNATTSELADVLGTLIADLKNYGLLR
jgi:hypothetical protein